KPVVYFAAAAAAMEVLGPGETAARLPAFLATLATLGLLVWFARKHWGADAGWIAALALATMPMPLAYARAAIFDSTLSLCTTAAILCFSEERPVLAWAAMGAGALTKGPVALLIPLAAVVPWALLTGGSLRRIFDWRGIAAFAVVALPWFLAVPTRVRVFPQYVFVRATCRTLSVAAPGAASSPAPRCSDWRWCRSPAGCPRRFPSRPPSARRSRRRRCCSASPCWWPPPSWRSRHAVGRRRWSRRRTGWASPSFRSRGRGCSTPWA